MGKTGQKPGSFLDGLVDGIGQGIGNGIQGGLFLRREHRNGEQGINEVAVTELRGHPACGRVRMLQVALLLQGRHRIADGGRAYRESVAMRQAFRRHRHGGLHESVHDLVQHVVFSRA
jgi:hypothetical protein